MPLSSAERDAAFAAFAATRAAARALFISGDVIDRFLETSTPTQVAGCRAMLEAEVAHRDANRRARLLSVELQIVGADSGPLAAH